MPKPRTRGNSVLSFLELHVFLNDGLPVDGVLEEGAVALGGRRVGAAEAGASCRRCCGNERHKCFDNREAFCQTCIATFIFSLISIYQTIITPYNYVNHTSG